jgi:hypothetical protein
MTNDESIAPLRLVIRHSLFNGHWGFVIGHFTSAASWRMASIVDQSVRGAR